MFIAKRGDVPKARSLLFNAGLTGLAQAMGRGLRFFVASFALAHFGAASWGEVAYALTLVTYLNFVLDFGISSLALIDRPDDVGLDRKLFVSLSYARGMLALPLGLLAFFLLWRMDLQGGLVLKLYLLVSLSRPLNLEWWLQRKGFAGVMPMAQLLRQLGVLLFVLLVRPGHIESLVAVDVALEFATVSVSWFWGPRREFAVGPPRKEEWRDVRACYTAALPLFLSSALLLLHQNVDIFFLRYFCGLEAVGLYDYSYRFVQFAFVAGGSLSIPLRRQLALLRGQGADLALEKLVGASHKALGLLSLAFLLFALYGAGWFFAQVLGNHGAEAAQQVLVILGVWLVLAFYSVPLGEWLVTHRRKRYVLLALVAACVNVLANTLLVTHWGVQGAAWAKVASELAILLFLLTQVPCSLRFGMRRAMLAHVLLVPALLLYGAGLAITWWMVGVQMLVLALVLIYFRYFSREEWNCLRSH